MEIETIGLLSFGHFREVETLVLLSKGAVTVVLLTERDNMEHGRACKERLDGIK